MKEELYIENQLVDLVPNKVSRTLQIGKLGDVADRESNYSNTVKLPFTQHNIEIFDDLGVVGNMSRSQYRKLHCRYIVDGIPLIQNGYCVIKSLSDAYEVVMYDGIIDLGEKLSDKKLSDLNFSDINHTIAVDNFEKNLNNTQYIYALGDYGVPRNPDGSFESHHLAPSLFIAELWDRIFKQNGFDYRGDFFEDNRLFRTELLAPGFGYLSVAELDFEGAEYGTATTDVIKREVTSISPINLMDKFELIETDIDPALGVYNATTKEIDITYEGQLRIDATVQARMSREGFGADMTVQVLFKLNGELVSYHTIPRYSSTPRDTTLLFNVKPGDTFAIYLHGVDTYAPMFDDPNWTYDPSERYGSGDGGYEWIISNYGSYLSDYEKLQLYNVDYRSSVELSFSEGVGSQGIRFEEIVPDMTQLDLIRDVVRRYGLLIRPVRNTNTFEFIEFEKLLTSVQDAEDWSDKYITTNEEEYDSKYGKRNIAKYKYPSDTEEPTHDGEITIDVETAADEKTLFQSPYTISKEIGKWDTHPFYSVPIWEYEVNEDPAEGEPEYTVKNEEASPRIFRLDYQTGSVTLNFFDEDIRTITGELPILSLDNISMKYFLGQHYLAFGGVINTFKELEVDLWLNEIDLYDLNFFRLKYLKQYGKYYYLNKLKYSAGQVATASLIEINEFRKNQPPTQLTDIYITIPAKSQYTLTMDDLLTDYIDPEDNLPRKVKFTSGLDDTNVIMKSLWLRQAQPFEVTAYDNGDLPLIYIEDLGNLLGQEHTHQFTYKIMDRGSNQYSEVEGTIHVTVLEYVNNPPNVDFITHGNNYPVFNSGEFLDGETGEPLGYFGIHLIVWGVEDTTDHIVSKLWEFVEKPAASNAWLGNVTSEYCILSVPIETDSVGTYRVKFTVCDNFGVCTVVETEEIYVLPREERDEPYSPRRG